LKTTNKRIHLFILAAAAGMAFLACEGGSTNAGPAAKNITVSVAPTSIQVSPGRPASFTSTVTGTANVSVTWAVVEPGGGSIDSSGHYTAPQAEGTYHVVAGLTVDPARSARATVVVSAAPSPPPRGDSLAGVGWTGSTSLVDYPKTGPVTSGGPIVDIDDGLNGETPYQRLMDALALLSNNSRVIVRNNSGGAVRMTGRINRTVSWSTTKEFFAYGTQHITIDASPLPLGEPPLRFSGASREHWKGFELVGSTARHDATVLVMNSTYMKFEDWSVHHNPAALVGLFVFLDGSDNVIQDCLIYHNGDGSTVDTNTPDGISMSYLSTGPRRIRIVRCFIANAADDGVDFWAASDSDVIDSAIIGTGTYWNGNPAGDGNGIKMGGHASVGGGNRATGCVVVNSRYGGVIANGAQGTSRISHISAYANDIGNKKGNIYFQTRAHQLDHIISRASARTTADVNGGQDDVSAPVIDTWNCWNSPFQASRATLCQDPRFVDPTIGDLSLSAGSPYVGTGQGGATLGASTVALDILRNNWTLR
jgi:hypothetical protein